MKQKLLNNFRLRAVMLVAMMCAAFTGVRADVTDVLNNTLTGVSGTSYSSWSGKTSNSDAVYAGQSAGGNSSIQLRSNNNNSGVVTTASGGTVKSITVTWNSNTASGRTLNVYGKNSAYSAPTDLYNTSTQGDLLGTIVCGTSTELVVSGSYEYIGFRSANSAMYLDEVQITWTTSGGSSSAVATTVTIDDSGITNTDVYAGTAAGSLAATVTAGESAVDGATVTWSGNNDEVATIDAEGAVTLVAAGSVTFTASYAGVQNQYKPSSKTYTMNVTNKDPSIPGTENNPYTVAQARAAIDAGTGITGVYATGIVSGIVTAYNSTYGNISYNISDDGLTTSDQLQAYRGFDKDGAWFTSEDDVQVGDVVVIYGNLKKYSNTYEFDSGNQRVSFDRPAVTTPTITANPSSLTGFTYVVDNGPSAAQQITIGGENLTKTWSAYLNGSENSYFEFSFIENEGYSSDGSLGSMQEPNQNVPQTIYVRLKSGLPVGDYDGAITISSEGAETVTVNLSGSVTAPEAPNVTWNLATASYDEVTNENIVTWSSSYATMTNSSESGGTKASNYLGGDSNNRTSSRFYNGNTLTITPASGFEITSIVFEATSESYASTLASSEWTNASASASKTTVTVTPTSGTSDISAVIGGTCGLTSAKVYYQGLSNFAPVWSELPTPEVPVGVEYELDLTDFVSGVPAPTISIETGGDIAQIQDNVFSFTPTEGGSYEFTFRATNTEGFKEATLTVTVSAAAASIEVSETTINIKADETTTNYVIVPVTYTNFTPNGAHAQLYEADGVTPLQSNPYTWIMVGTDGTNFFYKINETNTSSEPRTVYCKILANDANNSPVYSDLITITQAGVATDYATLPFNWEGGAKSGLLDLDGVTAYGLGSDYAAGNAPYLVKFDGTGDYIQVKTDSRPGVVTVGVKMLGGAETSTITVQESADGETFTDVEELTISGNQNDALTLATTKAFAKSSRYVRLLFTKGSNVGVGPISISEPSPSITITPDTYNMDAKAGGGELPVVSAYLADDPKLEVVFVEADGETSATYDWISAEINNNGNIDGQITANTGDARTAYFYVQGVDADNNVVKSNLVTFTQEAAITEPYITVGTGVWNFDADGGSHTFSFDYGNLGSNPTFEVAFFDQTGETEIGCGWISYEFVDKVTISAMTNDEGAARTAYFKVHAIGTEIYSNLVTINQAAPEVPIVPAVAGEGAFVKVTSNDDLTNGTYLIVYEGDETHDAVAFNGGLETLDAIGNTIKVNIVNGKIESSVATVAATFDIRPSSSTIFSKSGKYIGNTSNSNALTASEEELTNTTSIDESYNATITSSGGAYLRYNSASNQLRFRYYKSSSYTGQQPIALYKYVAAETPFATAKLNAEGYATFSSVAKIDLHVEKDFSAWQITSINGTTITFEEVTSVAPASTGLLLKGKADKADNVAVLTVTDADETKLLDNKLIGITTPTQVETGSYYGLKGNEFVPVNAGTVPAGKALLPAPDPTSGVKAYTFIFNDADGIQTVQTVSAEEAQAIFNLAGQRLPKAQKGINIINGKKVLVK